MRFFQLALFVCVFVLLAHSFPTNDQSLSLEDQEKVAENYNSCRVCLEDIDYSEETMKITTLACSHKFHQDCLSHWVRAWSNCPICRANVTDSFMKSVGITPMTDAEHRASKISSDIQEYSRFIRELRGQPLDHRSERLQEGIFNNIVNPLLVQGEESREKNSDVKLDEFLSQAMESAFSGLSNVFQETSDSTSDPKEKERIREMSNAFSAFSSSSDTQNMMMNMVQNIMGSVMNYEAQQGNPNDFANDFSSMFTSMGQELSEALRRGSESSRTPGSHRIIELENDEEDETAKK